MPLPFTIIVIDHHQRRSDLVRSDDYAIIIDFGATSFYGLLLDS